MTFEAKLAKSVGLLATPTLLASVATGKSQCHAETF